MKELFTSTKYDNNNMIYDGEKYYTVGDIKKMISFRIEEIKNKCDNIVIADNDSFSFIINFFAAVFCRKNLYLITDKARLNDFDEEFYILDRPSFKLAEKYELYDIDINLPLINLYTSGSSGTPKIIKKSLYNLIREAEDIGENFDLKNKKLTVSSTTSMCHLFGLTFHFAVSTVNHLIINTKSVSYPENIDKPGVMLVATPTFLSSIPKFDIPFKFPPEYIVSAGSKLNVTVFEHLEKQSKIIEIYGSSETGVIAYKTHFSDDLNVFPRVKINVFEDNCEVLSDYLYGESAVINDKLEVNNGKLIIKKRTDRLFKIYEKRVSADELEEKMKRSDLVKESYILESENKLACLCALSEKGFDYLLENGISQLSVTLKNHLKKYSEVIPQRWRFIDQIPMTQAGKINKKLINHIFNVNLSLPVILDRKIGEDKISYKIFFYSQCNFFNGHFPEFKLVPGVLQLYLAKEFASAYYSVSLGQGQWKRIKFMNIIEPDSIINLDLTKSGSQVTYEFYSDSRKYSSGVFLCENIFKEYIK